jgi:PAS domain S-box-containing protein
VGQPASAVVSDDGGGGSLEQPLTGDATSPRTARQFVAESLDSLGHQHDTDLAVLLVSELVTNAAIHARGESRVRISSRRGVVRVEVMDPSATAPVMRARNVDAEAGRGMLLVEELADAWGVDMLPHGAGKVVWFELGDVDGFGESRDDRSLEQAFADLFPRVLHDAPSAILLVDLQQGTVTFANARARELAPSTPLPCPTDEWSAAADLRDPTGQPLAATASPLWRVAAGQPVAGEPVTVADPEADGQRRLVWVTGFPLSGVPSLTGQALVTFFEMAGAQEAGDGAAADALHAMRDRAVIATDISFTITDPRQPDNPLVWVNPAFTRMTGYEFDESVGGNCRFLQGRGTDESAIQSIRDALAEERPITLTLLNYRKDGTAFWNELSISPVLDADGAVIHFVGVQADVTARVQMEQSREAAYRAEQQARHEAEEARAEAEVAQMQMTLLAEATALLSATLDVDTALKRLSSLAVPMLADWCTVELSEDAGGPRRRFSSAASGADREAPSDDLSLIERCPQLSRAHAEVLAGDDAVLLHSLDSAASDTPTARTAVVVPLRARRRVLGAMTLATTDESGRRYDRSLFELAQDLGRRAGMAVDNARLYTREHEMAEQLQRSLLPTLPRIDGLAFAERYLASSEHAEVGGDWYDALPLPDGAIGLAIGDVMGHDMGAAAAMSQLRSVLRSYAWEGGGCAEVLDRLDRLIQGLDMAPLATALYARLEPPTADGSRTLRYANAGHLPPLVVLPGGSTELLTGGQSLLLGVAPDAARAEGVQALPSGTTLLLYTDGLIERRGEDLDVGLLSLRRAAQGHAHDDGPDALCERVLGALVGSATRGDDVALLAIAADGAGSRH